MTPRSRPSISFRTRTTDRIAVAIGTTKGLFLMKEGSITGPWLKGQEVMSFAQLGERYLLASTDPRFGAVVRESSDGGESWSEPTGRTVAFSPEDAASVARVWQLHVDRRPGGGVFAGVEPAALFSSPDGGTSFELVRSLWDHPHRKQWEPGGGGLCLHTIVTHPERPDRIIVAISTGGVYRSDDGGQTWAPRNEGILARFLPEPRVEFGQCVHKVAVDAEGPDVLWLQHHWGIYLSRDGGDSWEEVGYPGQPNGVPSDFGFPIVAHPVEPGTAFVFPLESDMYRCSPGGACRVYRTTDYGKSWEALGNGLPFSQAHLSVLRDAFDVGSEAPFPLVFGTRTGQVYGSADGGENWRLLTEHLPPVLCVRVLD